MLTLKFHRFKDKQPKIGDEIIYLRVGHNAFRDTLGFKKCTVQADVKNDLELAEKVIDKTSLVMDELKMWEESRRDYMDRLEEIYYNQIPSEKTTKPLVAETYDNKFIYLITEGANQKIGVAQDVEKRVIGMQTSCPYELKIVATYAPNAMPAFDLEKRLHLHYESNRLKGEWFSTNLSAEEFKEVCEAYDKIS